MFNTLDDGSKKTLSQALDHIDGILGDAMSKARTHLKGGETPADEKAEGDQPMAEEKYEGQGKPGGHAGHSFGASKDQKGTNNSHFGRKKGPAQVDNTDAGVSRRRSDVGMEGLKALLSK